MRRALLCLLLVILGPPAFTAPVPQEIPIQEDSALNAEEQRLITKVLTFAASGEGAKAAQAILEQPKVAEHSFYTLLAAVPDLKDPREKGLAVAYLNTVARVMESQGRKEFVASLRTFKLLVEPSPNPSPTPESSPNAP
jgi:hypothetical protein